jgi:HipA-like kinase
MASSPLPTTHQSWPVQPQKSLQAVEQIRRMRGGSQAHLMRCSDGHYYVVKFQNNPQHRRVLVNELLGTKLAARLELPTTPVAIVEVSKELIRLTPDLAIETPRLRIPCLPGPQLGSRYVGNPKRPSLCDFMLDEQLRRVANLHDFWGMLVFDKWTCNTDGRQTLFFRDSSKGGRQFIESSSVDDLEAPCSAIMIDQGFCFNAGEWNFPDAPLRGLYLRNVVYEGVTGMESFAPWLERLEQQITERTLQEIAQEIPPAWYDDDADELSRLTERLLHRRHRVEELIIEASQSNRRPFPNWIPRTIFAYCEEKNHCALGSEII